MNILFFINSLAPGGAERVTVNLANYWASKNWRIHLVSIHPVSSDFYTLHPDIQRVSLDLEDDNRSAWWSFSQKIKTIFALHALLKSLKPSVAVSMMTDANIILALASISLRGIKTIGSERIHPPLALNKKRHWEWLRKYSYGQLDKIVALTGETKDWLLRNTKGRHIEVIPNPVFWPLLCTNPILDPADYLDTEKKYLLAVGRLNYQKQFDLLIKIFKSLSRDLPDWALIIIGEGEERSNLERLVHAEGLSDKVLLPGLAGNIGDWYEVADLFVLSSAFEGFPNALLEAMAHGLPVVSFDCDTGPRDLIEPEVNGLLVTNGDVHALQMALQKLMSQEALRQSLGNRASEVREQFSAKRIASLWEAVFI